MSPYHDLIVVWMTLAVLCLLVAIVGPLTIQTLLLFGLGAIIGNLLFGKDRA